MATAANNTSLILNISGTQSVTLKRGEKTNVLAKAGQRYRVSKQGEEGAQVQAKDSSGKDSTAKDVAASQQGQDLLLSYADGTQVTLVNFYEACKAEQCAVDMPGAQGTGANGGYVITGDSAVGASLSDGGKLVYAFGDTSSMAASMATLMQGAEQARGFTHADALSTYVPPSDGAALWTPLHVGVGALGAAVLLHDDGKLASLPTVIHGSVVAGPVIAGNGLTAVAYKADGTVLATGAVNADGTFTLNVGNDYLGPVLVKVSDANNSPDYWDEATGAPKDLTTDLRALTVIPAAGTYNISVNVLTELAVRNLGLSGGDTGNSSTTFTSVNATQITQANQQVAVAVGLTQDLVLGAAPVAIVTTDGSSNAQTNDYGRLLAALSGAELGSNTNAVLDDLSAHMQSNQPQATGQVLERLLEGAAAPGLNLVASISDITNQKSTAVTIDAVSQDNRLSPAEMVAGVQVQGTAAAGASVTLTWSDSSGTATATGTRTVTADAQGQWSTSFASAEMPALGATTLKATVSTQAATRSIYLDEPLAPTITLTQMTGSGNLTANGQVDVSGLLSGAGWDYSLDGGTTWTPGSGSSFTATGDGPKQVLVRQNIGGHYSPNSNQVSFVLDATAPSPMGFALATDSGANTSDGISNVGTVNVTGIEAGAAWQYSIDGGTNWIDGTAPSTGATTSSFTLAAGTHASGSVQVRQSDAAGNTSVVASNTSAITIDVTAPSALSLALSTDSGSSATDGISNVNTVTVSGIEAGATWQYSIDGGSTWNNGTAPASGATTSSFTLAAGTHATGAVQVRQSDAAGNTSVVASNTSAITIDPTAPSALSLALTTDSGSSATDGISNVDTVTVSGIEAGTTWQYSIDGGSTWSNGTAPASGATTSSFTLAAGTHATGAVQVRQSDVAGNTSSAVSNTSAITIDAAEPTVSITSSANALSANATATLTFTLSEAIAGFSDANVTVTGGTLSNFSGSGTTYTATFTPDAGLSGAATVSVAASTLTDTAGNSNSAASNTVSITVDTQAPTVASITASQASLFVGQTASLSITLSEASTTFTLADLQAVGGTLSNLQGSGTSYTATFTPDDSRTDPGSVSVITRSFSDVAGNDSERSDNDGVVMAISTVRPTATLQARQAKLGVGDVTTIDITLSEKSANFDVTDLTASHGTLSEFTPSGDGIHYSVIFTPDVAYTGTGSVTLADGRFTNAAGNSNKGVGQVAATDSLAIDTTPPTVTITSDVTALAIGQSATITFTFNKDPGDSFDVKDITVNGGTLTNLTNNTGKIWTATFTPTDGTTGEASITVASGRYTDAAGNQGAAGITPSITLDTQGPVADSLLPGNATTVLPGHALILSLSEVVHKGTGNIVLVDDTAGTRTTFAITDSAVVLSNDGKTLTITPTTALVAGSQYHVEAAPGTLLDAAGNAWEGIATSSTWAGSGWHFTAATPSVSLNKITADNHVNGTENGAGVVISGLIESNTAGMVADFVAGDFTVTLTPQGSGTPITAAATNYNTTTGAWSLTLANNALVDGKTYAVSVAVTGTAGRALNATATTTGQVVADLSAAAPTLTLLSDTGSNNSDGKTSDATITVSGLEAKATWEYSTDNGSTWQTGSGNQFTGATADGAHTVQVRQTDAAGNVSSTGSRTFTLDTAALKPVINAVATDNIINASEATSAITGTAEAGASVKLVLGSGEQARTVTVTADGSGNWTHTLNAADMFALGNGQTQITATQTDVAGNESFTALRNLKVDTVTPGVKISTATGSDSLQLNAANNTTTLTFELSELSSDFSASSVTVTGGTLSTLTADASGLVYTGTFTANGNATSGEVHVAGGVVHDLAGNAADASPNKIKLNIDTVVPTVAITSNIATLQAGDVATVTFTLSEASDDFGAEGISVTGGTLGKLSPNATHTVYTAVFTPNEGFAGAGSISVASNAFHDRAFNPNADGADTNNTLALTIEAAPITLDISSDKIALKGGETATLTFAFSSAPTGFVAGDITVSGGTIGALTMADTTHYTATFTPTANAASGTASISVAAGSYTGASGNLGEGAKAADITFDTLAPTLKTLNPEDNGYLAAGGSISLVATFTENVSAGTGNIVLVDDTANTTQTFAIGSSAVVLVNDTLTLTPTTALVAGHNYHITIDSTALHDAAGNAYAGISNATSWNFSASNLSTTLNAAAGDGLVNTAEKTAAMAANGLQLSGTLSSANPAVLAALQTSDIVVRVTLPDRISDDTGSALKVVTATIDSYNATTGVWTASLPKTWQYQQGYFDFFHNWQSTGMQTRDTLIDGHTDSISVTVTGRTGTAAAGLTVTLTDSMRVDLSNPATPTLTLAGDTGSSNSDGITRNGLINVGALEAGGTWQYSLDNGANWQVGSGSSVALTEDGATTVQVKQADAAGNASATTSLAVTLDTRANAPVVDAIATDNVINASEAGSAITGTAEAGATVSLSLGANTRTVTANGSGVWSYTLQAADITAMGQSNEVIKVTQTDKAGNTSTGTSAMIDVDTVLPTITLANTGSATLGAGQSTIFTVTLNELSPNFSDKNLTVSGGTVSNFTADATGLVYTGTFTPTADSTTAGSIQVAASAVSDAAGNTNSAASNALALTINTVRPTVAVTSSVAAGTTLHAGDTATVTFTLSQASSDFTAADVTVLGGSLSNFAGSGTSYTATFTPDANSKAPGSVSVASAMFSNAATNTNADGADANNGVAFAIATVRPSVVISSDRSTLGGAQTAVISFEFSEAPGTSFTASDIAVTGGTLSAIQGAGTSYTALFTPTAGFNGAASITVASGSYTNSSGSLGQAGTSPDLTIDTLAATVAISRSASGTLGVGQTDTITFDFSEAPGSSFTLADVEVSGGTLVDMSAVSATRYVASFTPTAAANGTAKISIANQRFSDAAGNFNTDGADANNTVAITFDTVAPIASTLAPVTKPNYGATLDTTGQLSMVFSEAIALGSQGSAAITLVDDDNQSTISVTATVTAGPGAVNNTLLITPSTALTAGHKYHVTLAEGAVLDSAGNKFAGISNATTWNFTAAAPSPGGVTVSIDPIATNDIVNSAEAQGTFVITGVLSTTGSVQLTDFATTDLTVTVTTVEDSLTFTIDSYNSTTGVWSASVPGTYIGAAGNYFTAKASVLGHTGMASGLTSWQDKSFYVDTAISTTTLSLMTDTGSSTTDHVTSNGLVNVAGLEAKATWQYSTDGGSTWSNGFGNSFTLPMLTPATYALGALKVRQTDAAGNTATGSSAYAVDYRPMYTGNLGMSLSRDTGTSATDGITYDGTVNVNGLAATDTWRYSRDNGLTWTAGATTTNQLGTFNQIADNTAPNTVVKQTLMVEAKDLAGNTQKITYSFKLDKVQPLAPNASLTPDLTDGGAIVAATNLELGATVSYQLQQGNNPAGAWTSTYTPPTAPGSYTLLVQQKDEAGNGNVKSLTFSIAAPVVPLELSAIAGGTGGGFVINGQSTGDRSGWSVSAAGDVNGDGLADLIVGAPFANNYAGRSYVVFGKTAGAGIDLSAVVGGTGGFVINGQCADDDSGMSVSAAGDVNGDGLADLIVGVYRANGYAGRSYVVFGKTAGTGINLSAVANGAGGFVLNGDSTSLNSGYSVSAAGDVNGDGLADLIVGADEANNYAGRSYVVFGKAAGTAINLSAVAGGTGGFVVNGDSTSRYSGFSVSAAGDVNGDGLADLIVGSPIWNAGRSFVVFGKTAGTAINLSAVAGGTGGFVINGQCADDDSGMSVSAAGDVNGDGLADLIVGAFSANGGAGRSYVVFGKTTGTGIDLAAVAAGVGGFVINGQPAPQPPMPTDPYELFLMEMGMGSSVVQEASGYSVSTAGDLNGDGLTDLIVGAYAANNSAGRSYVVFGKTGGASIDLSAVAAGSGGFVINGQSAGDHSGESVSAAGDVNGDGLADLIVGASKANGYAGRSYVIFGSTTGAFAAGTTVDWLGTDGADTQSDNGGGQTLVAGAGDDSLTATAASVLYGGAGNDRFTINQTMITALQSPMGAGGNVGQLARIDGGSGIDTLVLSGSGLTFDLSKIANQAGANPDGGSRIDSVEAVDITGTGNNTLALTINDVQDMAGMNLFNSGNGWTGLAASVTRHQLRVDGNSGDVLKLGGEWARGGTATNGGVTYNIYNAGSGAQLLVNAAVSVPSPPIELSAIAAGVGGGFVINGASADDRSGYSVSSAGDVNGDGLADLIVSAPQASGNAGRSYVVFGKSTATATAIDLSAVAGGTGGFVINGQCGSDYSGWSVSGAGDVNGDGLADLIVGAYYSDPTTALSNAGRSYVVFGKSAGTTPVNLSNLGTSGFVINGQCKGDQSGYSVSSAGDVNGDGLTDLIVGANYSDPTTSLSNAGRSYVVFGKSTSTAIELSAVAGTTGGFVINGEAGNDNSGVSVSAAGDVNGDGLADVIVGANGENGGPGHSYVVFGKNTTTPINLAAVAAGTGGFVINGQSANDKSGVSVSAAGDVNGDGLADLIVGANASAPLTTQAYAGRSYVVFGQSTGGPVELSAIATGIGGFVINGQCEQDQSGYSVSSAGDVNGDGLADLIVGAKASDPTTALSNAGRSYVVFGKTSSTGIDLSAVAAGDGGFVINGQSMFDMSGWSVSGAGDVNGDGLADLVVGAFSANGGAGRSYVIFGSTSGAFGQTAVDWMGTSGADTQSDNGVASTLVGGAGVDNLMATAASVLYGGAGNDTLRIGQAMITALQSPMGSGGNVGQLARIDGGSGLDTILLSGTGLTLDLTAVANQAASNPDGGSRIDSIEKINLVAGSTNTLKLTAKDVLDMGSANTLFANGRNQLMVTGDGTDTVDLADGSGVTGWTKVITAVTIGGTNYFEWKHTSLVSVYVMSGVVVI